MDRVLRRSVAQAAGVLLRGRAVNYAFAIIGLTLVVMIVAHPADPQGHAVDDGDAAAAAGDEEDPDAVQGRSPEAQRGAAEVLQGEQHQPGGWLPSACWCRCRSSSSSTRCSGPDPQGQRHGLRLRAGSAASSAPATGTSKPPSIDRVFDPAYLQPQLEDVPDLSQTNTMKAFGMDLAESASKALSRGVVHALPYLVLIAIVARHRLRPAAPDPGPQPEPAGQPAAADDHEDHADLPAGDLLRPAGRPGPLLRGLEPLPGRPAVVHHPQHLRHQAGRPAAAGAGSRRRPRRPRAFFASLKEQFSTPRAPTRHVGHEEGSRRGARRPRPKAGPSRRQAAAKKATARPQAGDEPARPRAAKAAAKKPSSSTAKSGNGAASSGRPPAG